MNMSIILQIGASHFSSAVPNKGTKADVSAELGTEPSYESSAVNCGTITQLPTVTALTTYPNCCGLPYQDHNYGAPPPPTPPQSPAKVNGTLDEDTSTSIVTTSTINEEDGLGEESVTRCICEFDHDDEYMICCDKCSVWQHVDCMGIDRNNIPETYMCEKCEPRRVDRQKAKALQTRKKEEMTADSSSDETGDENSEAKSAGGTGKGKKIKRRRKDKTDEKLQTTPTKRVRRRVKEKVEPRRTTTRKRRKSKSSVEVNHVDENTRDSWDSSVKEWMEKYEEAETNQYSPEVHLQLSNLKFNGQHEELARKVAEHPRIQLCHVADISKTSKGLLASTDIRPGQIVCEYRGKFLLSSQFQEQNPLFNYRSHPFVLFYTLQKGQEEVCVDSREYGNDSRFIRRSCMPNAEVHHVIESGSLHLYIVSLKNILMDEEITLAFDSEMKGDPPECACMKATCALLSRGKKNGLVERTNLERQAKRIKRSLTTEDDSEQAPPAGGSLPAGKPCKVMPLRMSQSNVPSEHSLGEETMAGESDSNQANPNALGNQTNEEAETEEQASERRRKMTREERKMEAIMKAFARMEKTEQRRQEALARLAQKKEDQETKKKDDGKKPAMAVAASAAAVTTTAATTTTTTPASATIAAAAAALAPTGNNECRDDINTNSTCSIVTEGVQSGDETKPPVKCRKGKKRKNSGNPVRRRSRMNSGGSDILSPDESSTSGQSLPVAPAQPAPTPVAPQAPVELTTSTVIPVNNGFKFPKTKKLMMTEWFSESTESAVHQPLTIKTEPSDFTTATPTCYMRSARSPSGISQAHLRRASAGTTSTHGQPSRQSTETPMGSAKKRWLRQAMCEEVVTTDQPSPVANGSLSPTPISNSPSISPPAPPDLITPLKKRRLARESMSSDILSSTPPSTPSPSVAGQADSSVSTDCQMTTGNMNDGEMQFESTVESSDRCAVKEQKVCDGDGDVTMEEEKAEMSNDGRSATEMVFSAAAETLEFVTRCAADISCPSGSARSETPLVTSADQEMGEGSSVSSMAACSSTETSGAWLDSSTAADSQQQSHHQPVVESMDTSCAEECSSTEEQHEMVSATSTSSKVEDENNGVDVGENSVGAWNTDNMMKADSSTENRSLDAGNELHVTTSERCGDVANSEPMAVTEDFQSETSDSQPMETMPTMSTVATKPDSSATASTSMEQLVTPSIPTTSAPLNCDLSSSTAVYVSAASSVVTESGNNCSDSDSPSQGFAISSSTTTGGVVAEEVSTTQISSTSPGSNSGLSQSSSSASTSPLSTTTTTLGSSRTAKRKVSLHEYRKRKMENQTCSKCTGDGVTATTSSCSSGTAVSSTVSSLSPTDLSAPPQLSTLPLFEAGTAEALKDGAKDNRNRPEEDVKWSSNPTSLEQQRENLTQRLRREFGLVTDEDSNDKEAIELVQNGRPIGCYPSHPPAPQQTPVVRAAVPVVRNIPTIIGITGYKPPPRVLHQSAPGTSQQFAYQQYPPGLYGPTQQFVPSSQYGAASMPTQQTRALRPLMSALPQVTRTLMMGGPASSLTPYGEQVLPSTHLQPIRTTRPPHPPPLLPPQLFHDAYASSAGSSTSSNSSSSSGSSRKQIRYKQGYYQ